MKKGDKAICIRDYIFLVENCTLKINITKYLLCGLIASVRLNIRLEDDIGGYTHFYKGEFERYFITTQQIRKQKLEKINERR